MREDAVKEFERRFNLLSENAKPNTIAYGTTGSRLRFHMALNILGCPNFGKVDIDEGIDPSVLDQDWQWIDDKYCDPILTEEEYFTNEYDELLDTLFVKLLSRVNGKS
jgi:hypothetical protein